MPAPVSKPDDPALLRIDGPIATITLNRPAAFNSVNLAIAQKLEQLASYIEGDDAIKVVLLRGAEGVFSTGADMGNAYGWYGKGSERPTTNGDRPRRPSQRRRLAVDRESFGFYHQLMGYPKVTVAEVEYLFEPGEINPDHIITSGVYVQRLIHVPNAKKHIEQRTVRKRTAADAPAGTGQEV